MPRVACIVGKLAGIGHTKNMIDLCLHQREPFERLLVFKRNAAMHPNDGDRVVAFHQCALRAWAINSIARAATSLPAASSAGPRSRAAKSALHAITRALAGAATSPAIDAKTRKGSTKAGSTPSSAKARSTSSLREGRPSRRRGVSGFKAGFSAIEVGSRSRCNIDAWVSYRMPESRFLEFSPTRAWNLCMRAREGIAGGSSLWARRPRWDRTQFLDFDRRNFETSSLWSKRA